MTKLPKSRTPNLSARWIGRGDNKQILFRWNIGPALRAKGFKATDLWAGGTPYSETDFHQIGFTAPVREATNLTHKTTTPMGARQAAKVVQALNKAAKAQNKNNPRQHPNTNGTTSQSPTPQPPTIGGAPHTVRRLMTDFLAHQQRRVMAGTLAAKSLQVDRGFATPILKAVGPDRATLLTADLFIETRALLDSHYGETMGHHSMALLLRAIRWARKKPAWKGHLPGRDETDDLRLPEPAARLRVGTPNEMKALYKTFINPHWAYDQIGTPQDQRTLTPAPMLAYAQIIMLWTCMRVQDALTLTPEAFIQSDNGDPWLTWMPAKTNRKAARTAAKKAPRIQHIPLVGPLREHHKAMLECHKRHSAQPDAPLILNLLRCDNTPQGYTTTSAQTGVRSHRQYTKQFNTYRDLAGHENICPTLCGNSQDRYGREITAFKAQDFRDTAVTRLLQFGCTLEQIAPWHGSPIDTLTRIIDAYGDLKSLTNDTAAQIEAGRTQQGLVV